jgi:hypothetical protein
LDVSVRRAANSGRQYLEEALGHETAEQAMHGGIPIGEKTSGKILEGTRYFRP